MFQKVERSARRPRGKPLTVRNFPFLSLHCCTVQPHTLILVVKVFRGSEAFALFLKSYQHILQKQCYTLVHTFGLPPRLEEVVRNQLWAPRLRLLTDRLETSDDATVFSSQATSDAEGGAKGGNRGRRRERKSRSKVIPSLMDSLGMCYLGMIVLRLPISLGDLHR